MAAAVVGIVSLAASRLLPVVPWWVPVAASLAVLVFGVGVALARYRVWRYEVRDDALYLERGVFTRVRTVVPFVRIQHVDSSRGPLERLVGLASTVVYTAGSRGADVAIPGLTPEGADDLRERLKRLAIRAEGEDAV
ncbi:PH domain-containing protein [Haloplanus sp. C73]|uniref:PH domain-containing protein n=1 Tax=Haloplanus sp. C73 TaxID=3421641 RepID=UPI003EB75D4B